jgi:hypothetical protein
MALALYDEFVDHRYPWEAGEVFLASSEHNVARPAGSPPGLICVLAEQQQTMASYDAMKFADNFCKCVIWNMLQHSARP